MNKVLLKLNKAKCLICGDILISKVPEKVETCTCGAFSIAGGYVFLERRGTNQYKEMSEMADLTELNPNENKGSSPPSM